MPEEFQIFSEILYLRTIGSIYFWYCDLNIMCHYIPGQHLLVQWKHQSIVWILFKNAVLVSLSLTYNRFHRLFWCFNVDFEQVNTSWVPFSFIKTNKILMRLNGIIFWRFSNCSYFVLIFYKTFLSINTSRMF